MENTALYYGQYYYESDGLSTGWIIGIIFIALAFMSGMGAIAASIAKRKGRSAGWFWMGFFFGLIGILITMVATSGNHSVNYNYQPNQAPVKSVEQKLLELQRMFDNNLISEEEFNTLRKKALEDHVGK